MTVDELNKVLDNALEAYSVHIRGEYKELSSKPATEGDIHRLAQQTFYLMNEFKKAIIKFEKER